MSSEGPSSYDTLAENATRLSSDPNPWLLLLFFLCSARRQNKIFLLTMSCLSKLLRFSYRRSLLMPLLPHPLSRSVEPYGEATPHSGTILFPVGFHVGDQAGLGEKRTPAEHIVTPAALPFPLSLCCHEGHCPKYDRGRPARHPEPSAGSRKQRKSPRAVTSVLSRCGREGRSPSRAVRRPTVDFAAHTCRESRVRKRTNDNVVRTSKVVARNMWNFS